VPATILPFPERKEDFSMMTTLKHAAMVALVIAAVVWADNMAGKPISNALAA
jgi:hypothetical protein